MNRETLLTIGALGGLLGGILMGAAMVFSVIVGMSLPLPLVVACIVVQWKLFIIAGLCFLAFDTNDSSADDSITQKTKEITVTSIKEIYQKMRNGDSLTTPELQQFVEHMSKLEELLLPLGPEFAIVRTHVTLEMQAAESFLHFRGVSK